MVESYHSEMDVRIRSESQQGQVELPYEIVVDYQAPDSLRADLTVTVPLYGSIETQMVRIGDTAYATNPDTGEWEFVPFQGFPIEKLDLLAEDTIAGIRDPSVEEVESIGGFDVYRIAGTMPASAATATTFLGSLVEGGKGDLRVVYWIGVDDSLIRQIHRRRRVGVRSPG